MRNVILIATVVLATACSSTAPDRSARAESSFEVMQQNSMKARLHIDKVNESLDALLNAPADKVRDSFEKYEGDVKKMNDYADMIRENDRDLRKNGKEYLRRWEKDAASVSDPQLREIAEQRQTQMAMKTSDMQSTISIAAESFTAYLRDLNDIKKVVGNDLTMTGISTVANTTLAQTARDRGEGVKRSLENAERAIGYVRDQMKP